MYTLRLDSYQYHELELALRNLYCVREARRQQAKRARELVRTVATPLSERPKCGRSSNPIFSLSDTITLNEPPVVIIQVTTYQLSELDTALRRLYTQRRCTRSGYHKKHPDAAVEYCKPEVSLSALLVSEVYTRVVTCPLLTS